MNPPKMPVHIGDLLRDTGHLRATLFGAYLLLLFHHWSTGSLPNDDDQLSSIARLTPAEWKKARPILIRFFDEGWHHVRVVEDLAAAKESYERRAKAGEKGGKAKATAWRSSSNATAPPEQPLTFNQGTSISSLRSETKPKTTTENPERVTPASPSETLSPRKPSGLGLLGTPLPPDWVPDDTTCERVKADFGMTDDDLRGELPAFHALNVSGGVMSQNWTGTFYMFCKRWKEHRDKQAAKAPPRVEVSNAPFVPTEADWDRELGFYARTGRWSRGLGPDPMSPACKAPRHLFEKHGIDPKTGERQLSPRKVPA